MRAGTPFFAWLATASALTERSFGVPDGINNGQFGAGPVIDFFGLSSKFSNFPVEFVYPETTAIVPANIALISGAKNTGEGRVTARETNKVLFMSMQLGNCTFPSTVRSLKMMFWRPVFVPTRCKSILPTPGKIQNSFGYRVS